jgi:hypothetical protein
MCITPGRTTPEAMNRVERLAARREELPVETLSVNVRCDDVVVEDYRLVPSMNHAPVVSTGSSCRRATTRHDPDRRI